MMMIMLGREYFHISAWSKLSPSKLNEKMIKWQTCLGSQKWCLGLEGFKDFFSLQTLVYFLGAIKTKGSSLPLPREEVFMLEGQASLSICLRRREGADSRATLYKLRGS